MAVELYDYQIAAVKKNEKMVVFCVAALEAENQEQH